MNTSKGLLKRLTLSLVAIGFAMLLLSGRDGLVPIASAQDPPRPGDRQRGIATFFGMQTLAPTQTAHLTVVNPSEIVPCIRVILTFDIYEADPASPIRLRFVRRVSREVELDPGEAASFEFSAGGRGAFVSPATFAREVVEEDEPYTPTRVERLLPAAIRTRATAAISTLLINERGRVIFAAPGVRVGFDPQPDPPSN